MRRWLCLIVFSLLLCTTAGSLGMRPKHYELHDYILGEYKSGLIPKANPNDSIVVRFSVELYQIIEVNELQQFMELNTWIAERWTDRLIGWKPEDFDNITELMLPVNVLWIPDTTLYNSLVMQDGDTRRLQNAKVTTTGKHGMVEVLYPTIYRFSCMLNLRFFPFDVQSCKLTFGSWAFDNTNIDYELYDPKRAIGTKHCVENEGWTILGTKAEREELHFACCPHNYTLLNFYLIIQRKPLYWIVNLIAPTSVITLIAIIGFFSSSSINDLREEKISLGITTLLSMSILIFMVADQGILGIAPKTRTVRLARRVGAIVGMQLPLLMKQALAEDRLRRATACERKESVWKRIITGKIRAASPFKDGTKKKPTDVNAAARALLTPILPSCEKAASYESIELMRDERTFSAPMLPPRQNFANMKRTASFDSNTFNKINNVDMIYSNTPDHSEAISMSVPNVSRNLAEFEYDWLAAVIERCCLILFFVLWCLMSVGINAVGMYYWYTATLETYK